MASMKRRGIGAALVAGALVAARDPAPISMDASHMEWYLDTRDGKALADGVCRVGNDGNWSTVRLQVGEPAEAVNLLVSTSLSEVWVVGSGGCVDGRSCSVTCESC